MHPAAPDFIRVSPAQMHDFDLQAGINLPMLRPESGVILELERVAGT